MLVWEVTQYYLHPITHLKEFFNFNFLYLELLIDSQTHFGRLPEQYEHGELLGKIELFIWKHPPYKLYQ